MRISGTIRRVTLATRLSLHLLSPTIGAEIWDIDLSVALAPGVLAAGRDRHCVQPEFTSRFRWKAGSVAFWDNRATLHCALDDYGDLPRYAHRFTLRGDRPFGHALPAPTPG